MTELSNQQKLLVELRISSVAVRLGLKTVEDIARTSALMRQVLSEDTVYYAIKEHGVNCSRCPVTAAYGNYLRDNKKRLVATGMRTADIDTKINLVLISICADSPLSTGYIGQIGFPAKP